MSSAKLIIDPKKWLGDNKILKMDWDVKAMHFHLMLISWQNIPIASIESDHKILAKYLTIDSNSEDWKKRIWPQLKTSWEEKTITVDGETKKLLFQPGLVKEIEKQIKVTKKKNITKIEKFLHIDDEQNPGFDILILINEKSLFKKKMAANTMPANIWSLGTELLKTDDFDVKKARIFLAKLAKDYGAQELANAISQLGMMKTNPIEAKSYLVGSLKKMKYQEERNTKHNQAGGIIL